MTCANAAEGPKGAVDQAMVAQAVAHDQEFEKAADEPKEPAAKGVNLLGMMAQQVEHSVCFAHA